MIKTRTKILSIIALVLGAVIWFQQNRITRLTAERDRYRTNNDVLLSEITRIRVDSATMALDTKVLQMTLDEYKQYRAKDAATIKRLGVRLKNLDAAARHELEVSGPIGAVIRDTVIIRDTVPILRHKFEMLTPHIELSGIIENKRLKGTIRVPITLNQAIWIEYKRRWIFWKRVKAMHQTISSNNPYAALNYSEYIQIR